MRRRPDWSLDRARQIVSGLRSLRGALLPMLHALHKEFGYIDDRAIPLLARELNITRADVEGVVSFYHDFRRKPGGAACIKICRAEACQAMGSAGLYEYAQRRLGIGEKETTSDGQFTLESVYCLGNCALSPSMLIGDELHGRVDSSRFDEIIAQASEELR